MVAIPVMNLTFCTVLLATHYPIESIKFGFIHLGHIALERFICIKLALRHISIVTFSRVLFTFVLTWICGAIFTFLIAVLDLVE